MNRSLNVFFGVLVCVGLVVGLFVWTKRSMSDSDKLNPYDFYNSVGGATYSVGGSGGVGMADGGLSVPMHGGHSMFRHRGASSYAPAYTAPNSLIASSPNSPIASSPITYTSSSAMTKSFGGGNAMGGGVSMSGGAVSSSPNSPIASSASGLLASSPNSLIASSPITSSPSFSFYGTQTMGTEVYSGAGIYAGMGTNDGTARGIRGRQNGGPSGFGNDWWRWLDDWYNPENGNKPWGTQNADGTWCLTYWDLQKAYREWCAYMESKGMAGALPSEDVWIAWFMNSEGNPYEGNNGWFQYVPVGDALPLLLIALLYALLVFIKSKKSQVLTSNSKAV